MNSITHDKRTEPITVSGPRFQDIPVGARVRPKNGQRRGTVIAIIAPARMVAVRWDRRSDQSEAWATDTLVVLASPDGRADAEPLPLSVQDRLTTYRRRIAGLRDDTLRKNLQLALGQRERAARAGDRTAHRWAVLRFNAVFDELARRGVLDAEVEGVMA